MKRLFISKILILTLILAVCSTVVAKRSVGRDAVFSFIVTADMRGYAGPNYQSSKYFLGTCEAIRKFGKGSFMISPGDIDPPQHVLETIKRVLGEEYLWYPVVGNHEAETFEDMAWLREWGKKRISNLVRRGPENGKETTYSFDFKNAHFVVMNQYYDGKSDTGTDGDISMPLFNWLAEDLASNSKPFVFVFGHKPFVSISDIDNGRHRHKKDSLNAHPKNSHRFQKLLRKYKVTAYVCGHTHNLSFSKINGLWQLDAGHSRGIGDTGAPSTFLKIFIGRTSCWVEIYRDDSRGGPYTLSRTIVLN